MVAAFIAIVVPQVKSQACTVAALVASMSGVLLVILPCSLGIVIASLLGILAGLAVDLTEKRKVHNIITASAGEEVTHE